MPDLSAHAAFDDDSLSRPETITRASTAGPQLRVVDARTGRLVGVPADRRILLRVCVHLSCTGGRVGLTDLRAALIGDVLQRVAEVEGLQVTHVLAVPDLDPEQAKVLDRAAAALGIHPPVATIGPAGAPGALHGPPDVHVIAAGVDRREVPDGVWIAVGQLREDDDPQQPGQNQPMVDGLVAGAVEATAVRLALLTRPYREEAVADPRSLGEAAALLRDWRRHLADWAQSPSRPVPDEVRRQVGAAFTRDLDTPAALALLRDAQGDGSIADGAKFETFASVDRVLGLELARDIGQTRDIGQR